MIVPRYETIKLEYGNIEFILEQLVGSQIGDGPISIELPDISETELNDLIQSLEFSLERLKINPSFPFPIYLVSDKKIFSTVLHIVKSVDKLPKFFKVPKKRLSKVELTLLNKVSILKDLINNLSVGDGLQNMYDQKSKSKKLHDLERENNFYERLLDAEKFRVKMK